MSDCRHLTPKICGNKLKPFLSDKGCGVPRFVGIEDVTINQGIGIDLTEGVYAYDGNGNEIEYTVTPDSIDMCDVGEHTVIYRAMAEGKKFAPWFCSKQRGLAGDLLCNRVALRKDRTVTIEQIDPPMIEGLDTVKISPNVEFDPTEGVTAIDGNGNEIEYTYSGLADAVAEGAIASFESEFEQNARSVLCDIEPIQSGSGTPSPDNVRPISGRTECVTSRCGKNLYQFLTDTLALTSDFNGFAGWCNGWKAVDRTKKYTYSVYIDNTRASNPSHATVWLKDKNNSAYVDGATRAGNQISAGSKGWSAITIDLDTLPNSFYLYFGLTLKANGVASNPMVEVGTSRTDYEAYDGTTHTTSLGRTVYGGTLDVVSGVLTVDRAIVDLGSLNWTYNSGQSSMVSLAIKNLVGDGSKVICDRYTTTTNLQGGAFSQLDQVVGINKTNTTTTGNFAIGALVVKDTSFTDATAFKSAMSGHYICYELATPQTYQLSPTEIALLKGQNNVWCDTGEVRVVYQESMPIGESIEYETVGERIITYTATDVCGNTSEVEREILVGITAQACKSQACGAFVYCAPTEACEAIVGLSATACE